MPPVIPWYTAPIVLSLDLFLVIYLSRLVIQATVAAGLEPASRRRVVLTFAALIVGWFGLALLAARSTPALAASGRATVPLSFPFFIAGAIIASRIALRFPAWRRTVDALPLPRLIGVQLFRLIGALFLVLLAAGTLPAPFATAAGWGDIAVGLTAPLVAFLLLRRTPAARAIALGWNALGLLDLVIAVGLGTGWLLPVMFPGSVAEAAPAMGIFPLSLVPTFAVPLALVLHLYSLRIALRAGSTTGSARAVTPAVVG